MNCEHEELNEKLSELIKRNPEILRNLSLGLPNLRIQTLGGSFFWDDIAEIQGWRLQENIITGHWRLLDPSNVRFAWGTSTKMVEIFTKAAQAMEETENDGDGDVADDQEEGHGEDEATEASSPQENIETEVV